MIENLYNGCKHFPKKSAQEKITLDTLNELDSVVEIIPWLECQEEIRLIELIYKGKGQYKTFQGFIIWEAFIGETKGRRVYINLRKCVKCSPTCLKTAKEEENTLVRRDLNVNVFRFLGD